ncbi:MULTISPECIES: hypothetical protein [unclassified Janthinobacterium]|uniref:hypothetical protein n=1 Tax=unclassified Janthinobacterium TaxID=2610881 RepID=UPI001E28881F|nr:MULTISPECIES: hypothetical protein [unclassified Janthinobacterium]MCC7645584.1 hypothetical protein [Janthinobacterium sp. EB271-G4-3-1]MCC7691931.1 hypothetical protein [Janthinobacterium sp. EB271-G4-3-2]
MMWMVGGALILLVARFLWLAYFHRVNAMSRQAELMNWLDIGRVSNPDGGKDILLARNERGARIDWRTGEVWLMNPKVAEPFADFLAVERWLTMRDMPAAGKPAAATPAPVEPEPEPAPDAGPVRDTLPAFQQKVDACLAKAEGGQELLETKQAFEAGSEPYLEASTELSKTALELEVSPAMVATFHISAFAALAETAGADKLERVAASLHAAARQIRASVAV